MKKKTNMEGPLGDHIQIVVSYVCSDKHECRYNTNRLVFTSKYNLCHVENFRSSILIRKILIGNIYSRIYRIKYTFRTQNKSRWNVYIKLHIIIWLPIGIFKISIVRHTHTHTRARARARAERERELFVNTYFDLRIPTRPQGMPMLPNWFVGYRDDNTTMHREINGVARHSLNTQRFFLFFQPWDHQVSRAIIFWPDTCEISREFAWSPLSLFFY